MIVIPLLLREFRLAVSVALCFHRDDLGVGREPVDQGDGSISHSYRRDIRVKLPTRLLVIFLIALLRAATRRLPTRLWLSQALGQLGADDELAAYLRQFMAFHDPVMRFAEQASPIVPAKALADSVQQ